MSKARQAFPTVIFVDEYYQLYQDLFPDVRSFEHFKFLHVGIVLATWDIRSNTCALTMGSVASASRFCRAFDEVRQFFRVRTTMKQKVSLAHQREVFRQQLDALKSIVAMA